MDLLGFHHRIDAVPPIGAAVEIETTDGVLERATVIVPKPDDRYWAGIGDDVRLLLTSGPRRGAVVVPSLAMRRWRKA